MTKKNVEFLIDNQGGDIFTAFPSGFIFLLLKMGLCAYLRAVLC